MREKERFYLDTNLIFGFFENMVRVVRGRDSEFKEPEVIQNLRKHQENVIYIISPLVKAEIFRRLNSEFELNTEDTKYIWDKFLGLIKVVELEKLIFGDDLTEFTLKAKFKKRTLLNIIHLLQAMKIEAYFVTGDKDLKEKAKDVYDKILSYPEFLQKLENI